MVTRKTPSATKATGPRLRGTSIAQTAEYTHQTAKSLIRPEVGVQPRFKKRKPPAKYQYDASLAPELQWDGQNPARERGEALIAEIDAASKTLATSDNSARSALIARIEVAIRELKALSKPFLNWTGKAERLSFEVPTLPMFIHERLSTQAILDSVKGYKISGQLGFDFHGHPDRDLAEQLLKSYEHPNGWFNRIILGDSLVVMNSLVHYEHLAGQVQMIYLDPPYGVKFGSNFQPFVRKRDVTHNDDEDMTREPEMVKAYRDTWELGLHSYLTYLRDRLLLARELLADTGSIFVQISDENLHHVREVMDEVFGTDNCCSIIPFSKTSSTATTLLGEGFDYLLWYAKSLERVKYRQLYLPKIEATFKSYKYLVNPNTLEVHTLTHSMRDDPSTIPTGSKIARLSFAVSQEAGKPESRFYTFNGVKYDCGANRHWKTTNPSGLDRLATAKRLIGLGSQLNYVRYLDDFPVTPLTNAWTDTGSAGYSNADPKLYVVQTDVNVIQRCLLMTTEPGDLVLDPTCGSGTSAYVAEQWGRRWITIDTSRVPLALARQRLLTATFDYFELKSPSQGPAGGFVYKMKRNNKGEHIGGIVPHITLKSIANEEPPEVEILVDRPEKLSSITRVTGPFLFEATIPTAQGFDDESGNTGEKTEEADASFIDRMVGVLQASPVLHLGGGKMITFTQVRRPARTLWLSAEAMRPRNGMTDALEAADAANGGLPLSTGDPVAIVFGPAHGVVTRRQVEEAWGEAQLPGRGYKHLYVIGFAIEPEARQRIDDYYSRLGLPVTYVQATPDVLMGDLLKNMRSSQIFSVCGQPDVDVRTTDAPDEDAIPGETYWEVQLRGLDVFDPSTDRIESRKGLDVPAWFLDTDYNSLVFRTRQAFFPRTAAWDNLKRSLKAEFDDSVWEHLAGDTSTPFIAGDNKQIAVKVIDDRGNELMVVRELKDRKA